MVKSLAIRQDKIFHALADNTRRSILRDLAGGEKNVSDIARPYAMSLAAVSKHLKVLEAAGLVTREKRGTTRILHINARPMKEALEWLAHYESFWLVRLDSLEAHLEGEDHEHDSQA